MSTDSEIGEVVARVRQRSLTVCENCGGQGYADMGASACATCFGAGVTTPEMLAAIADRYASGWNDALAKHCIGDSTDPCDCRIGDCKRITRGCFEMKEASNG